jgi:hypothetical protein
MLNKASLQLTQATTQTENCKRACHLNVIKTIKFKRLTKIKSYNRSTPTKNYFFVDRNLVKRHSKNSVDSASANRITSTQQRYPFHNFTFNARIPCKS